MATQPGGGDRAGRRLPAAARRALAEAEQRRHAGAYEHGLAREEGGRDGPEPTRYGDWEKDGITSDF
ncbi:MAG: hypothetical protein BroJett030_25410 [Alphaproteobacteria bacterium]|nr:MAG: hypothetical protein BroJett030_25410 [Alphaproteobacteria bacterium]